ncbi:TPA: carboxypeptidase regulatory-like domain-containing protein [Candidatus Poribacteria bacterium]|nr:carboxypeptidase regulatory-like domain-containing protein [Candidatus Poribacteria bacterium]
MLLKKRIFAPLFIIIGMMFLECIVSYAMPENQVKQATGSIKGSVKNLTINQVVPNQEVSLYVYQNRSEVDKKSVVSDETGSFTFSGLEIDPTISYSLTALYQNVEYSTKLINLGTEAEQTIELNVFDVSDDDSKIQAAAYHLILEPMDDGLYVTEYIIMANSGNTSFLTSLDSKNEVGFSLQLPKGYRNINFQQGFMECCVSVEGNTLLYSHATQPGMTTFIFSYQMPPQKKIDLSRQLSFNTGKLFALVSGAQFTLTSTVLENTNEQAKMQNKTYAKYIASGLSKGQIVDLQLELPYSRRFNPIWFVAIIVVVGLSAVLIIRNVTGRKQHVSEPEETTPQAAQQKPSPQIQHPLFQNVNEEDLESLKTGYLELISRLDEMYEAGEISESAHHLLREEQKARLGEVMAQLGQISQR